MVRIGFLSIAHMHAFSYGDAIHKLPNAELVNLRSRGEKGHSGSETLKTKFLLILWSCWTRSMQW